MALAAQGTLEATELGDVLVVVGGCGLLGAVAAGDVGPDVVGARPYTVMDDEVAR